MQIGERIARTRKDLHMTQEQLAERMEVARQTVSKWEADIALPETAQLGKLSEVLECSVDEILGTGKNGSVKIKGAQDGGYTIDWTEMYPILKQYQGEMDCQTYEKRFLAMLKEAETLYGYSPEDAMLALKDLFYHVYLKRAKEKR